MRRKQRTWTVAMLGVESTVVAKTYGAAVHKAFHGIQSNLLPSKKHKSKPAPARESGSDA